MTAARARADRARTCMSCSRRSRSSSATTLRESPRAKAYLEAPRHHRRRAASSLPIGYAPDSWDAMLKRFGGTAEREQALAGAGLVIERSGKAKPVSTTGSATA